MKIVLVSPEWPYPLNQGGRIRMFHMIKHLAATHTIHLVSVILEPLPPSYQQALEPYCCAINLVPHPQMRRQQIGRLIKSLISGTPYAVLKYSPEQLGALLRHIVSQHQPDKMVVISPYLAGCAPSESLPVFVDFHDIAHILYERFAQAPRWTIKKFHGYIQNCFMRRLESELPQKVQLCLTVSEEDQKILQGISGQNNVLVVPNGVDTTYFHPDSTDDETPAHYDLLYVGSMDYHPNVDAVLYLCREIMPHVWRKRPQTTVIIVGRAPLPPVRALAHDPRIFVTDTVSDVRHYYAQAKINIAPLRIGSGSRLKILEAAAMAKPIISTPIGLEGIKLQDGVNILIKENPLDLANAVIHLLQSPEECQRLGQAARELILQEYSWQSTMIPLQKALQQSCKNSPRDDKNENWN
jgi:polysaccharide biosynthesis protein PslH